jgi:hypothetical protein
MKYMGTYTQKVVIGGICIIAAALGITLLATYGPTTPMGYTGGTGAATSTQSQPDVKKVYANRVQGITIRFPTAVATNRIAHPEAYASDESYSHLLSSGITTTGVRFFVPLALTTGTNLSPDSFISIERIASTTTCTANFFLDDSRSIASTLHDDTFTYSYATSSDAGAGNRYEENVYALPDINPCVAVRYFIHYGAIENYDAAAVKAFDKDALLSQFDTIRRSLVLHIPRNR